MSNSVIRKITRGISSNTDNVTISCSITDTSKVIVILNGIVATRGSAVSSYLLYLNSISNSNIIVYNSTNSSFSYQIIEFM